LQDIRMGSVQPVAVDVVFDEIWHRFG
jgi:hypothetical protein